MNSNNIKFKMGDSAGGVVQKDDTDEVILVNSKGIKWTCPKGHIEKGEDPLKAARREIYEEAGVNDLELVKYLGSFTRLKGKKYLKRYGRKKKTIFMYLFKTNQLKLEPVDRSIKKAVWVNKMKINEYLTHDEDKEFFSTVFNQI
ncbi:MAG: NUDIX domain-containing protein [Promethearchaeota archaeon]|nr:MAG: NUDIX domain-containing protein [Candidatus Lokiarchaeota archaeon]